MSSRCVFAVRRQAQISAEQFAATWRGTHADCVREHAETLGILGYTQLHTVRRSAANQVLRLWRGLLEPYDGIDVWWLDRDVFAKALRSKRGKAAFASIVESERTFIDHAGSAAWLAEAHLFRDVATPSDGPTRKLVWVGRGLAPQTDREFQYHYLNFNGPLVHSSAADMGIQRYLQVHTTRDPLTDQVRAIRGTGEPYPVSAELNWNPADMLKVGVGSLSAQAVLRDEETHIDFARSAIWQADEHVLIEPPALELSEAAGYPRPDLKHLPAPASLLGKVAVVTGAASGIGREVAIELARRGCELALVTRHNRDGLEQTAAEVRGLGRATSLHLVDTTDRKAMQALPEQVVAEHGAVHILVNNAGVTLFGDFEQQSLENIDWIVGTNLGGVLNGCKFFIPYLKREGFGHICNVSSLQGLLALTSQSTYAATKFAVRGFSEALRGELEPHGVGVSCVFPGMIRTEIVSSSRTEGGRADELRDSLVQYVDKHAMAADRCAVQIVDAIENNTARALITPESKVTDALKRLFPTAVDSAVARFMRRGLPTF